MEKTDFLKYTTSTCHCLHIIPEVIQKKLFKRRLGPFGSLLVFPIQMYVSLESHMKSQT